MAQEYFIGLMSGTSMDGIDAALVSFDEHDVALAATGKQDYPQELRAELFTASREPESCAVDALGELHTQVGECFRDAALALLAEAGMDASAIRAIGSHGQTVRHRPDADHPFTMQIGDPSIIATGTGIDTVADFRAADVALGGQGAPLTPAFHAWLFRDNSTDRVVLNIGGIANVTILPSSDQPVSGFDTGPGNTLLDAWIEKHQGAAFDDAGRWAAAGTVDNDLLQELLNDEWIGKTPPKSTGFEYFNLDWLANKRVGACGAGDVQATLLEFTAASIADSVLQAAPGTRELFVCGGGAHNPYLLQRIGARLPGVKVATTAAAGMDPDWVEAVAFAWLAMRRIDGRTGNLPAVTGAARPAVLGALYPA